MFKGFVFSGEGVSKIISDAFSPTIILGALVFPLVILGKIDESTTLDFQFQLLSIWIHNG